MRPLLIAVCVAALASQLATAQSNQEWQATKRTCGLPSGLIYSDWLKQGAPCPARNASSNSGNASAASAAASAAADEAAAETRRRDAELEQQRVEAENQRRADELARQRKFDQDKQAAFSELKGISAGQTFDSQLKGETVHDSGLKDASHAATGLKTLPPPGSDPMVVDSRHLLTGLPKSIEAQIPHTPAGDRVRRGFQEILDHDWNAARAWFKDALNQEPGNAGLARLVDLADYTIKRANSPQPPHGSAKVATPPTQLSTNNTASGSSGQDALDKRLDDRMSADLASALKDFNRNYLPRHPELQQPWKSPTPVPTSHSAQTAVPSPPRPSASPEADWMLFFRSLFTPPRRVLIPTSVSAVRG